jgi:hypothetical protein
MENPFDLFNNPMVAAARKALPPELLEKYKKLGESLYNNFDFVKGKVEEEPSNPEEVVSYIEIGLKSGLHPSFLKEDEIRLLDDKYGRDTWLDKYGYEKIEL